MPTCAWRSSHVSARPARRSLPPAARSRMPHVPPSAFGISPYSPRSPLAARSVPSARPAWRLPSTEVSSHPLCSRRASLVQHLPRVLRRALVCRLLGPRLPRSRSAPAAHFSPGSLRVCLARRTPPDHRVLPAARPRPPHAPVLRALPFAAPPRPLLTDHPLPLSPPNDPAISPPPAQGCLAPVRSARHPPSRIPLSTFNQALRIVFACELVCDPLH